MKLQRTVRRRARGIGNSLRADAPVTLGDALVQAVLLLSAYAGYALTRAVARGGEEQAVLNGKRLIETEKALGMYVEPWLQTQVSHFGPAISFFNWFYATLHIPMMVAFCVWVYFYRNEAFAFFRNAFLALSALAVTVFALIPVAPPRLIATSGLVDTLYLFSSANYQQGTMSWISNPYSALPSLHFGYALFIAIGVVLLARRRAVRVFAVAYPALVGVSIIVTGNHYVLDALGGAVVVAAALLFAGRLQPVPQAVPQPAAERVRRGDRD